MSEHLTAAEIRLRAEEFSKRLEQVREIALAPMINTLTVLALGRLVHAKRARKLRRRGETVRLSHRTATGKCAYRWVPTIVFVGRAERTPQPADQQPDQP